MSDRTASRDSRAARQEPERRESGRRRRQEIVEAVLRLVAREGIRAIRHRAVAREAAVPLAATTYYFDDIAQLLRESFTYFAALRAREVETFLCDMRALLERIEKDEAGGMDTAAAVADRLSAHILAQSAQREDRSIELAFKHEALRDPELAALVAEQDQRYRDHIASILLQLGSPEPAADAQITLSVILRLEGELAFGDLPPADLSRIVRRHIQTLMAASAFPHG